MEEASLIKLLISLLFLLPALFFLWLRQSLSISRIKLFAFLWNRKIPSSQARVVEGLRPVYSLVGTFFFILFIGYISRTVKMPLGWEITAATLSFLIFYIAIPWYLASVKRDQGISVALRLAQMFTPLFKEEEEEEQEEAEEAEVEGFIEEGMEENIINQEEKEILRNIIEFSDTLVREIMTPQKEIIAVPYEAPLREVAKVIEKEKKSRIPVYKDTLDTIEGIIYAKDIVGICASGKEAMAGDLMREAVFVPESIPVSRALETMKEKRTKIVIVVDEYGVVAGLITMEDIIEEIFGEITEIDESPEREIVSGEDVLEVEGDCPLWELEESLGIEFPEGSYSTISGFIMSHLGRIARRGEEFEYQGFRFKVLDADRRSLKKILIRRKEK